MVATSRAWPLAGLRPGRQFSRQSSRGGHRYQILETATATFAKLTGRNVTATRRRRYFFKIAKPLQATPLPLSRPLYPIKSSERGEAGGATAPNFLQERQTYHFTNPKSKKARTGILVPTPTDHRLLRPSVAPPGPEGHLLSRREV